MKRPLQKKITRFYHASIFKPYFPKKKTFAKKKAPNNVNTPRCQHLSLGLWWTIFKLCKRFHTQAHYILVTYSLHVHCLLTMNRFLSSYQGQWVKPKLMKFGFFISSGQHMMRDGLRIFKWTKLVCFQLFEKVKPLIIKQDTKYCKAIPIGVWIACAIYKNEQGAKLLIYSELFAIGEFIISWCFDMLCMLSMWCIGFCFIAQ
jgi:hypothetical protein